MPKKMNPRDPATGPTVKLLLTMANERQCSDEMKEAVVAELRDDPMQGRCSALIDYLKLCDRTPEAEAEFASDDDRVTEEGYYRHDGVLYQVVRAKAGHLYPVEVSENRFAKGVFPRLRASERVWELEPA